MKTICFINHKGGVGKTTLSFNYAHYLSTKSKVLFLDLDPQMAASFLFDSFDDKAYVGRIFRDEIISPAIPAKNIHLLNSGKHLRLLEIKSLLNSRPARAHLLKKYLTKVQHKYDFCIIDTAPNIDVLIDSTISNSDHCIIPIQSEILPILGLEAIKELIEEVNIAGNKDIKYSIMINMFSKNTKIQNKVLKEIREEYPNMILKNNIRRSIAVVEAQVKKLPIFKLKKDVAGDFIKVFKELNSKIVK